MAYRVGVIGKHAWEKSTIGVARHPEALYWKAAQSTAAQIRAEQMLIVGCANLWTPQRNAEGAIVHLSPTEQIDPPVQGGAKDRAAR